MRYSLKGFSLVELAVSVAIIAIIAMVALFTLNPSELLKQSRDSSRLASLSSMHAAIGLYQAQGGLTMGSASVVYVSAPDPLATSTVGDQCQGLRLPPLSTGRSYHCAASTTLRNVDGTGWLPVNFLSLPGAAPETAIPIDATNQSSSGLFYTYATNGTQYELSGIFESQKYIPSMANDGGAYDGVYQIGSALNTTPPFRSYYLVGYWPLGEGSGSTAIDYSGKNNPGTWSGIASGTSGYYAAGKFGSYAGYFDGSTDGISYSTNVPAFQFGAGSFSLSAWINPATLSGSPALFGVTAGADGSRYALGWSSPQLFFFAKDSAGNAVQFNSTASLSTNAWYLGTMVVNKTTGVGSLYVNGILDSTSSLGVLGTISGQGSSVTGKIVNGGTPTFGGLLNDIRVYNYPLSAAEVQAIYMAEK